MNRIASAEQARRLDAASVRLGVSVDALMALAGFQCARLARRILGEDGETPPLAVLAGRGNNGADALGCARHLAAWGHRVRAVALGELTDQEGIYAKQARAAAASGVDLRQGGDDLAGVLEWALDGATLVIDGLLGTGSAGAPRGTTSEAIRLINESATAVLAIDLPSGLDATSGERAGTCVRADDTLMLAIAKSGCVAATARAWAGRLWLADIGVPTAAYAVAGLKPPHLEGGEPTRFIPTDLSRLSRP